MQRVERSSIFYIDSQNIKLFQIILEDRGIDASKKVNRRKRQVLVDSQGRIWFATYTLQMKRMEQRSWPLWLIFYARMYN